MRSFSDKEKEIINKLISIKRSSKLEELQVARLLREQLSCFAIKWTLEPKKELSLYSYEGKNMDDIDWNGLKKNYFQIVDFLYLIEELENYNLIKLQTLSFDLEHDEECLLYDRNLYEFKHDAFWHKSDGIKYLIPVEAKHNVYVDFVNYLEKYANKVVYPLPLLEDLAENEFKSIEQRNFEKQLNDADIHHKNELKVANRSYYIALLAVFISAIVPFGVNKCTDPVELNSKQIESLQEAIKKSKVSFTDSVKVNIVMSPFKMRISRKCFQKEQ